MVSTSSLKSFLNPQEIVKQFKLEAGDHVADFGAGHGFFTIPIARVIGGDGKIFAIDIQKPSLDIIRAQAKVEHLLNVEPVWGNLEEIGGSKLKDTCTDLVVVANILFQAEDKFTLLREAYRILRQDGRLAIIEWDKSIATLGPPMNIRIAKDEAKNFVLSTGFSFDREIPSGTHHYGLMFVKK